MTTEQLQLELIQKIIKEKRPEALQKILEVINNLSTQIKKEDEKDILDTLPDWL